MTHHVLVDTVVLILIGGATGYFVGITASPVTITNHTTVTMTTFYPLVNATAEVDRACSYLASNFDTQRGLVSETPDGGEYYLYSDNYLAFLVLDRYCHNPGLAQTINETLSQYDSLRFSNQYTILGGRHCLSVFNASKTVSLGDSLWTTLNNQSGDLDPRQYVDVAFLEAYFYANCRDYLDGAIGLFDGAALLYDGMGFNDSAYYSSGSPAYHQYQTYKLALYVFMGQRLGQPVPLAAYGNLLRMQDETGGFHTGYDANLSYFGTNTNTETTCLAIMALDAITAKQLYYL